TSSASYTLSLHDALPIWMNPVGVEGDCPSSIGIPDVGTAHRFALYYAGRGVRILHATINRSMTAAVRWVGVKASREHLRSTRICGQHGECIVTIQRRIR